MLLLRNLLFVIPAQAGIHPMGKMDPCLRRGDEVDETFPTP